MSQFDPIIKQLKSAEPKDKKQMLAYLLHVLENNKNRFVKADIAVLEEYVKQEVEVITSAISEARSYKEKDILFDCEDSLIGIIMQIYPAADEVPEEFFGRVQNLVDLVKRERVIEETVDSIFKEERIEEAYIDRLISLISGAMDEYQKGRVFAGLAYYKSSVSKFTPEAKAKMASYIESELSRYLAMKDLSEECLVNIEFASDVSRYYPASGTEQLMNEAIKLGKNDISYFALGTLMELGKEFPQGVIKSLANDLIYAELTYSLLEKHGKKELFPKELATEEYLAKSDMVHWLTYPTELGKAPDKIEYVGKVKYLFKKEVYHVFKFTSDSDNLGDDLKNKWLIGWASTEGGTFSNFDEYALFEKDTVKKTLSNIKKKLLGR